MSKKFELIGWISRGMEVYREDRYKAMFGHPEVRVPPKIYRTERIARRYGKPVAVYIRKTS